MSTFLLPHSAPALSRPTQFLLVFHFKHFCIPVFRPIRTEQGEAKPHRGIGLLSLCRAIKSLVILKLGTLVLNPGGTLMIQVNEALMGGSLETQ